MRRNLVIMFSVLTFISGPVSAGQKAGSTIDIVPCPREMTVVKGEFELRGAPIVSDPSIDVRTREAISAFAERLSLVSGRKCPYSVADGNKLKLFERGILFVKSAKLQDEEYHIRVGSHQVIVEASCREGFLYAIQTLKQMLPVAVYGTAPAASEKWVLHCCEISDAPRFGYRGMHLDCCRHFFSVEEIHRYIDIMAAYKMNRLHWHLTEDQGWRIEISKYPRLTEVGAWREGTQIGKVRSSSDGIRYGGFYTKEQIREIVSYADSLGITIIPEVDLPGHMLAALASYPEFGCEGSAPYKVWTRWGVSKQVLSVGKEETMRFLEDVVGEVADLFPGKYFHIGGDECPKDEWKTDPACQAKIRELGLVSDAKASAEARLQNYVTARIQKYLAGKGKSIIGWDEILEGELAPGATVMSWRGTKGGVKASNAGFDVIMTPNTFCYFDYRQLQDVNAHPLSNSNRVLPFSKVYSFDPTEGLSPEAASHIKGVQANLWTEQIPTPEVLEFMLLPRMFAISEVQWCQPERKDSERINWSLDNHQLKILDLLGYNYCKTRE